MTVHQKSNIHAWPGRSFRPRFSILSRHTAQRYAATGGTTALTPAALQIVRIYACVSEASRRRERLGA